MLLSVIVPIYNEEEIIASTFSTLEKGLADIEHDLIFVTECSTDSTRSILEAVLEHTPQDKLFNVSRNFGHHGAFSAGMQHAIGKAIVIIGGDLQDPASLL